MSLAAIAMASCSKDETMSTNNGHAIDFRGAMQTRATEMTTAGLESFFVTALDANQATYFENVTFSKSGDSYVSSPAYYWPSDDGDLSFFAYSPSVTGLGNPTLTINGSTKTLADFSPAAQVADQKDFITATATGNKTANESAGVALLFNHQLSQIEVKAKNTNDGYIYKVCGVRIGKPVSKGSFNFSDSKWSLAADKANYVVEYGEAKTLNGTAASVMAEDGNNAMLIPQTLTAWKAEEDPTNTQVGAYLAVKVQIVTKSGARVYPVESVGEYDWVAVPISTNWEAGKKYVYTLDFSNGAGKVDPEKPQPTEPEDPFDPGEDILGSAIKFTVDVSEWTESPSDVAM